MAFRFRFCLYMLSYVIFSIVTYFLWKIYSTFVEYIENIKMVKTFLKRHWLTILGVVAGVVAGYLYWFYVGCASGTCPITSSPVSSSLWGAVMGGLLFSIFKAGKKTANNKSS